MSSETERTRRAVLCTFGASLGAAALVTGTSFTAAGEDSGSEQGPSAESADRSGPLSVHGPTTVYPANKHHQPGVFGDLENVSDRTVWLARLAVTFYDDNERAVGTGQQYFLRLRPGEQRPIEIPFTTEWFDDRSWSLNTGLLQLVF